MTRSSRLIAYSCSSENCSAVIDPNKKGIHDPNGRFARHAAFSLASNIVPSFPIRLKLDAKKAAYRDAGTAKVTRGRARSDIPGHAQIIGDKHAIGTVPCETRGPWHYDIDTLPSAPDLIGGMGLRRGVSLSRSESSQSPPRKVYRVR